MELKANPHLVDGKYGINELVDIEELRRIFARFTEATGFTTGFLEHPSLNILIATGWQDICTRFHRGCPASNAICLKSNRQLLGSLDQPGKMKVERCGHGLVDCAFPIIVKGKHIASLATGQLFVETPDIEKFRRQSRRFGYDEQEYLKPRQLGMECGARDVRECAQSVERAAPPSSGAARCDAAIGKCVMAVITGGELVEEKLIEQG